VLGFESMFIPEHPIIPVEHRMVYPLRRRPPVSSFNSYRLNAVIICSSIQLAGGWSEGTMQPSFRRSNV
jgi:hypothetical protein